MPPHDPQRLELAHTVQTSLATEDTLSPIQARSFVRCLQTSWQVPTIQWSASESRGQLDDARRLIHSAEIFRQIEGLSSPNAITCYRRAAELLEWLSRATDELRLALPLELFAGGAYQLGGMPAMAAGLLSQVEFDDPGSRLYAGFLRGDFDGVLRLVARFWRRHPELTDREAPARLLAEDAPEKISWFITVELVRCLGLTADALRRGDDERLERALKKLDALDSLAVRTFSDDASMLVSLLYAAAIGFKEASIYGPVRQLAEINPDYQTRLEAFARGQCSRGRGILWSSQRHGLEKLLHQSSFALCTPTGSGKTLVANLALVKELLLSGEDDLSPLGLYLVPSRALAGEVEAKLRGELGRDLIITGLYGGADWGITDYWLTADSPSVLIATVEKADALMRHLGPILLARLRLLIVDEAHQVVPDDSDNTGVAFAEHNDRSIRLEGFVSRLLTEKPDIVRIALTAVAGGAAAPVAKWIEGRPDAEAVGLRYRSMRQIVGILETRPSNPGRMLLDMMNGLPLYVRGRDEPVYIHLRIPAMPQLPAQMRNSINRFNQVSVLWTALTLVDEDRRILISVAQEPEQTMRWYKEALELVSWQDIENFDLPEDEGDLARFEEARAACEDYCGPDSYEIALLRHGIATNHGQMPQRLRRLMVDLIDRRICPITVATATLTEGVNLPFDLIFLTSLKRTSFDSETNNQVVSPLSTAEFRNLAGRAGRPGSSRGMEGITLISVPQSPSTTAPKMRPLQRTQIGELQQDYEVLRASLLEDEEIRDAGINSPLSLLLKKIAISVRNQFGIQGEEFLEWLEAVIPGDLSPEAGMAASSQQARLADTVDELDGVLLSALEEISRIEDRNFEGADAEIFLVDLWQRTFTRFAAVQEAWLEQAFIRRGCALIEEIYPDSDERKRLYQYGFSPYVGRRFEGVATEIRAVIEGTDAYGELAAEDRLAIFNTLGTLISNDRGYGFRVRDTATDRNLLNNWQDVLAWWMQGPAAESPLPTDLRAWQRFVADNLEFRLGVAIGAVVAQAWSDGVDGPLEVPSLATWRGTTGLPWFGFWARELLRWGTLDPFVAFALAQGLARTRQEAAARRPEFEAWLQAEYNDIEAENMIDPQLFLEWQRSFPRPAADGAVREPFQAELSGTTGERGVYHVLPLRRANVVTWIDPAGYALARSNLEAGQLGGRAYRDDFDLRTEGDAISVRRVFTAH